jgi:hypothetical protein
MLHTPEQSIENSSSSTGFQLFAKPMLRDQMEKRIEEQNHTNGGKDRRAQSFVNINTTLKAPCPRLILVLELSE